ncbi:8-amino-7-oxononanoate synthase [Arenibacter antarcticus]|uniref:Aminotransferase class I/II-fold pyridoxal phosphate-dependent enzyme n=1 Tax=Arenibacter antarcticus TaxID=2040469 RepID=A0ABW5VNM2_9FLAO|nr:aminotransferase class I/II-fold pyridoxal phosphate-dependent enzyme [Arenibacter sp. H213]MCM4169124.1 8-amino-7-oxononanoate synthase [Arenibacter sp. H213]
MSYYIDHFPSREIELKGDKYLYFGGTSYLGLQTDKAFQQVYINNILKYGTNYGASRKANLKLSVYEEVENLLTHWVGSESSATVSSGYLAGQLVRQTMDCEEHKLFYAPNTHSALYVMQHGTRLKPYISFTALDIAIRDHLETNKNKTPVVFLDAIDFSGYNYPDFKGLKKLPLKEIILVVDDSHGIGVIGDNGNGIFKSLQQLKPKELLVCCSLGKGFGIQAGAIFGSKKRITQLTDTAFFGGASPAAPAAMASLMDGKEIYSIKRAVLKHNIALFIANIKNLERFKWMEGHPAFSFADANLTNYLEQHKILVTSFKYPDEDAALMSRIVISAQHTKEDIFSITELLNSHQQQ